MTSEPSFATVLGQYQRDLHTRLDELASLRRQADRLDAPIGVEVQRLIETVSGGVNRSARASEVLVQWLSTQEVSSNAEPGADRPPE